MEYCKHCQKKTYTVYNDFMVSFCATCKRQRRYIPVKVAFQCRECGMMTDESYPGQMYCNQCDGEINR